MTRERTAMLIAAASCLAAVTFFGGCSSTNTANGKLPLEDASQPVSDAALVDLTVCLDAGGPTVGDYPCDVGKVLADKCQPCHQNPPKNGAHFSLLNYEDSQQPFGVTGERRWQRMAEVIEPGAVPHMPYRGAPGLTSEEHTTLRRWFHECAPPVPEGTGCDSGEM